MYSKTLSLSVAVDEKFYRIFAKSGNKIKLETKFSSRNFSRDIFQDIGAECSLHEATSVENG